MAKEKKGAKSEGKKAKAAEKKQKAEKKAEKKAKTRTAKQQQEDGSDGDDMDVDQVLEEYRRQQEQFLKITETVSTEGAPRARAAAAFLASPTHANQLLLFGGEYFNGALATFFNDLHIYYTDRDEWRTVTSPNTPLPRSGHAWCRGGNQSGSVFLFGGEFSSPKQGTFYHYNDFWRLDPAAREWTRLDSARGRPSPPARSGHRMTYFKNYIILFGGFQDTAQQTRYLADLWLYDTANFVWHCPTLPPAQLKPDARSSFTLLPHEQGAVLYGGFSRVKATASGGGSGKQHGGGQRTVMKAVVHQDCFFLRITPPAADAAPGTPPTVRWERRKKPANAPNPARAGATMAYHRGRGILFGGVHDVEESEEGLESEFFNGLYAWNIERNRFFPLTLRKLRSTASKKAGAGAGAATDQQRVGRRNRAAANEEELLRQLAALEATGGGSKRGDADVEDGSDGEELAAASAAAAAAAAKAAGEEEEKAPVRTMPVSMEMPHVRFNSLLTVQGDVLYIYGGTYEKGDREFTFDDLHAIDLGKLDGCKEVYSRPLDDTWIESDDEDDDDDDDDDEEDDDEDEDVGDDGDVVMHDAQNAGPSKKFTPSKRRKASDSASVADSDTTAPSTADSDDTEADTVATAVDDGLPHPRPFESRRDFFNRTSNEWQEILMTNLRWKNVRVEDMTIKEIKTKAFELSEEKWWDCREEITALEDEQEAAGIGEVVSLADRGSAGDGGSSAGGGGAGVQRRR